MFPRQQQPLKKKVTGEREKLSVPLLYRKHLRGNEDTEHFPLRQLCSSELCLAHLIEEILVVLIEIFPVIWGLYKSPLCVWRCLNYSFFKGLLLLFLKSTVKISYFFLRKKEILTRRGLLVTLITILPLLTAFFFSFTLGKLFNLCFSFLTHKMRMIIVYFINSKMNIFPIFWYCWNQSAPLHWQFFKKHCVLH